MHSSNLWSRLRNAHLVRVLLVYLGASWVVLQVTNDLQQALSLPHWVPGVAVVLLLIGLVITLATAWVQSQPSTPERAAREEVPDRWELELGELGRALREGRLPHLTWARALVAGVVAFSVLFGLAGVYVLVHRHGRAGLGPETASAAVAPDGIAVLPFDVQGKGLESWREGMVDVLSTGLDGAAGLRAISSRTVLARYHEMVPDTASVDEQTELAVARRTGARYALLGSAVALGPKVRLVADVYALDGNHRVGEAQVQGSPDSVLTLVDRLAAHALGLILDRDDGKLPRIDLASVTTSSLPALKAYLNGEVEFRRGHFTEAAAAYQRAVARDSLFALAYYKLSEAVGWSQGIASARLRDLQARARALADRLPERAALIDRVAYKVQRNDPTALSLAKQAVEKYPDDAESWYELGEAYVHVTGSGTWDDAERAFKRAVQLAPRFAPYRIHLIDEAFRLDDSALVARRLGAYERLAPGTPQDTMYRLAAALAFGTKASQDSGLAAALTLTPLLEYELSTALNQAAFRDMNRVFLRRALKEAPPEFGRTFRARVANNEFWLWGHLQRMQALMARDLGQTAVEQRQQRVILQSIGLPIPDSTIHGLDQVDVAHANPGDAFTLAVYAAGHGDWPRHAAAVRRLTQIADSLTTAGDSASAATGHAYSTIIRAFGLWKHGRLMPAVAIMDTARLRLHGNLIADVWLGLMHDQAGQPRQALRYFRSLQIFHPFPYFSYHIGQDYARLGETDKARKALGIFTGAWADADPEFQPLVKDARHILAKLSTEPTS